MVKKIKVWKKLFGVIPYFKNFYQKNTGLLPPENLLFKPKDYEGTPLEKKEWAYEDAKNHKKFYDELIKEKVYPPGTKVKVKKMKHSDAFSLELAVPKVRKFENQIKGSIDKWDNMKYQDKNNKLYQSQFEIIDKIKKIAQKNGYNYKRLELTADGIEENPEGNYNKDIYGNRNYGTNHNPFNQKVYYIDSHIINNKLPFKHRKFNSIENSIKSSNGIVQEHFKRSLEDKFETLVSFLFVAGGIFISSNQINITGDIITELTKNSINIFGLILIITGIIGLFLSIKNKKK